jgi:phage tail sheath protein FI
MAGIYTMVDNTRGVWKAPANVSLLGIQPINVSHDDQKDLNVSAAGKIHQCNRARRRGTLVLGRSNALDGSALDWRYINVRRTMIADRGINSGLASKALCI